MNEEKLTDALEMWIQGRINNCVMGLLDRVDRLERERENADMVIRAQALQITELEDRLVESAPDEKFSGFSERVIDLFDTREFRNAVQSCIDNNDDLMTYQGFRDALEDITFTLRAR